MHYFILIDKHNSVNGAIKNKACNRRHQYHVKVTLAVIKVITNPFVEGPPAKPSMIKFSALCY